MEFSEGDREPTYFFIQNKKGKYLDKKRKFRVTSPSDENILKFHSWNNAKKEVRGHDGWKLDE